MNSLVRWYFGLFVSLGIATADASQHRQVKPSLNSVLQHAVTGDVFLDRLGEAVRSCRVLQRDFYSSGSARFLVGPFLTFEEEVKLDRHIVSATDRQNVYWSTEGDTPLSKSKPVVNRLTMTSHVRSDGRLSAAAHGTTLRRSPGIQVIDVAAVEKRFGPADDVRPGFPIDAPRHLPYNAGPVTDPRGNLWLHYKGSCSNGPYELKFRTLGDGSIAEFLLNVLER